MQNLNDTWEVVELVDISSADIKDLILKLANNEIAAIKIPNVYNDKEVKIAVENIQKQGVVWYPNFEFKQGRIGICATEYISKLNGKEAYFILEPESSKVRDEMFPGEMSPVKRMMNIFSKGFDTALAIEPELNNANYFTGLIRAMKFESTTHFDFAPNQLPGWSIAESQAQFAVVTYLQMPGKGGGLTVYKREWQPEDEKFNKDIHQKGPDGFEEKFLKDTPFVKLYPKEGEMVIFNSRHFHKVEGIESETTRFSINSFMCLRDGKLVLWN